jgi:high-affinity iron transporter
MSSVSIAIQSGTILLREGLEALLVIAAIAAFLTRSGASAGQRRSLYWGAGLAIVASAITAVIFNTFYDGAHDDRIEAGVLVLAAGLLFYMSGWLILKQDPKQFKAQLERGAQLALDNGTTYSLAVLSFLAVFREGAETILFLHALAGTVGGYSLAFLAGLGFAALCLAMMFITMQWLAIRLPLRPVFLVTSGFLFLMGLRFVGAAVQEMQEQAWLDVTNLVIPDWLDLVIVNPTREAMLAQAVIAAIAIIGTGTLSWRHRVQLAASQSA